MKKRLEMFVFLFAFIITLSVSAILFNLTTINTFGTVKLVGLESDTSFIDWGDLEPDETATYLIRLRATGNQNVTLTLNTTNWNPSYASDYLTLTWNYTNNILEPYEWITLELSLYASPSIEGFNGFGFDILIEAKES